MKDRKTRPVPIADVLGDFLARRGLAKRISQATVIDDWAEAVGARIAAVTRALSITPDGTLFVAVMSHAWMTELSLMEPVLLKALNSAERSEKVSKIRYRLDG
ncbi:MAG: DUF721 domain-containing protein [Gemmatimonadaceae bacterium]